MPGLDGVSAIRQLADRGVASHILVLTTYEPTARCSTRSTRERPGTCSRTRRAKSCSARSRAAARGEAVLSPSVATRLVSQVREPLREPLSQRELEVLELVARGTTNREAASRLYISEATVKTHLLHIYAKLGAVRRKSVNDRAAAVAEAFERGLLTTGRRSSGR